MMRLTTLVPVLFLAVLASPVVARAQGTDWSPPSRDMPSMPRGSELQGDWLSARSAWFTGVDGISGVALSALRAAGDARNATAHAQIVRFTSGPVPVVVWTDRNGDTRADMIEIFKSGGIIVQLIDADFDGAANVIRVYDSEGKLLRQNPV